ncbi:unnamed protein product [Staurois parvus]|uniref:Uncharacterized protein n=1 Tax=Staurois parvus TaxID=386267 RepID=A0ABN9HPS8_9NEOB|nr:unnamed protein product [Staurois parvus]
MCPSDTAYHRSTERAKDVGSVISATCQCPLVPDFSAHQCHINATYQCSSELPFSVTHQCQSVPPINASQCHLSVLPVSGTYQCQSMPSISVHASVRLLVPVSAA